MEENPTVLCRGILLLYKYALDLKCVLYTLDLYYWCEKWTLKVHSSKTSVIHFRPSYKMMTTLPFFTCVSNVLKL